MLLASGHVVVGDVDGDKVGELETCGGVGLLANALDGGALDDNDDTATAELDGVDDGSDDESDALRTAASTPRNKISAAIAPTAGARSFDQSIFPVGGGDDTVKEGSFTEWGENENAPDRVSRSVARRSNW